MYLRESKYTYPIQYGQPPHEYSLQKKGPALYDHSLPGADSADWGVDDRLHICTQVSTPEMSDPP